MSSPQSVGQNHKLMIPNKFFKSVANVKCSGMTVTNKICVHEEISGKLNTVNACNHSVQNLLSFCLLSKTLKIKIHKTVIFPLAL